MVHQLRTLGDPRLAHLQALFDDKVPPPLALERIGHHHAGGATGYRRGLVTARDGAGRTVQTFPHPDDVPGLSMVLLQVLAQRFAAAARLEDDLHAAALAVYGISAIHPFEDGNGRTAIDFAQYTLMARWGLRERPLRLPAQAHRQLGRILAPLDREREAADEAQHLLSLREGIARRLVDGDPRASDGSRPIHTAARWFRMRTHAAVRAK